MDDNKTNAAAIIAIAREAEANKKPDRQKIGDLEVLVMTNGMVIPLEKYADAPRRKRASVALHEAASFIDYVNRHKLADMTHVFGSANEQGGGFTAIIDYHEAERDGQTLTGWGEHTCTLSLETTPEWKRWIGNNGKLLTQEQFAEFIEENQTDIVSPYAGDVIDVVQLLQGKKTVNFRAGKNLKNGSIQLEYVEAIEVNGTASRRDDVLSVPDKIRLGIIPFVGAFGVEIEARVRFRIGDGGKLSFAYVLNQPWKVIDSAFKATRTEIEEKTGIRVLLGSGKVLGV